MRRVWTGLLMAATSVAAIVMSTATGASAQMSCTGAQTASPAGVSPSVVGAGELLALSGGGFAANQVLGIGLFNPPVVLASVASDAFGNYSATIRLPLETPGGQNEITVFGHGPNGTCHQSLALFSVRQRAIVIVERERPHGLGHHGDRDHHGDDDGRHEDEDEDEDDRGVKPVKVVKQPLARTGASSAELSAAGLALVALGATAVVAGRPRQQRQSAG
jgi:hypothetical protein